MISKTRWLLLQFTHRLWVRAALFAVLAVATALVAVVAKGIIPPSFPTRIGADSVGSILNILASSMLAVTTFSLTVMVSAFSAATNNVTPRATRLLAEDSTTQNTLAVFIGTFLYSLVGIMTLSTGAYGGSGRVVLFIVTLAVIVLIVVTIVRWIDYLSRLGRVTETTKRVEDVARRAIRSRVENPHLGGRPLLNPKTDIPSTASPVRASKIGYVQHIDMGHLGDLAEDHELTIFLDAQPGTFVHPARTLLWLDTGFDDELAEALRDAFTVGEERSFDQDPRFAISVLAEIASRALSPGINDPGTAIDVIGRAVRLLHQWQERPTPDEEGEVKWPRLRVPPIALEDLFDDAFTPIARDGAGLIEVQMRLQKALASLAQLGDRRYRACARRHAALALARAEAAFTIEADREVIRKLAAAVGR